MNNLSNQISLYQNISRQICPLFHHFLAVSYNESFLSRNQNLKNIITQVRILDFGLQIFTYLVLLATNSSENIKFSLRIRHYNHYKL